MNSEQKFFQKSRLSQVFLNTDWPCQELVHIMKEKEIDSVIEVGPGKGVLTKTLLEKGINVTALELDKRLKPLLSELALKYSPTSLELIFGSALRFDLLSWTKNQSKNIAVCGNIPYHISSPMLIWALGTLAHLKGIYFLVQMEFAKRLAALPNNKTYGSLSIYTQLRAKVSYEFTVERTCFTPVPRVDSAVVSLEPLASPESLEVLELVEKLSKTSFQQRRKKLSNSLASFLKERPLFKSPLDLNRRCDSLSPSEFVSFAKALLAYDSNDAK